MAASAICMLGWSVKILMLFQSTSLGHPKTIPKYLSCVTLKKKKQIYAERNFSNRLVARRLFAQPKYSVNRLRMTQRTYADWMSLNFFFLCGDRSTLIACVLLAKSLLSSTLCAHSLFTWAGFFFHIVNFFRQNFGLTNDIGCAILLCHVLLPNLFQSFYLVNRKRMHRLRLHRTCDIQNMAILVWWPRAELRVPYLHI